MHLFKMYSSPLRHNNERIETTGNASLGSRCDLCWKLNVILWASNSMKASIATVVFISGVFTSYTLIFVNAASTY